MYVNDLIQYASTFLTIVFIKALDLTILTCSIPFVMLYCKLCMRLYMKNRPKNGQERLLDNDKKDEDDENNGAAFVVRRFDRCDYLTAMCNSFLLTIDELMMFGTKGYRRTQRASFRSKWQLLLIAMVGYTVNHLISALINTAILGSEYDYIRPRCEEGWFGDQGAETYMIYNLNARNNTVPMWNNRVYMKRWITTRASPVYQRFLPPDDINNFTNLQYDALCVRSFYDCFTPYELEMEIPVNSTYFKIVVHEDRNTETESFPGGGVCDLWMEHECKAQYGWADTFSRKCFVTYKAAWWKYILFIGVISLPVLLMLVYSLFNKEHDVVGKIPNLTAVSTLYHMLGSSVDKELGGGRHAFVRYKSFEQQMLNSGHIRTVGHADYIETFNDERLLDAEKNEQITRTL